jgi:hypothetical protein
MCLPKLAISFLFLLTLSAAAEAQTLQKTGLTLEGAKQVIAAGGGRGQK